MRFSPRRSRGLRPVIDFLENKAAVSTLDGVLSSSLLTAR